MTLPCCHWEWDVQDTPIKNRITAFVQTSLHPIRRCGLYYADLSIPLSTGNKSEKKGKGSLFGGGILLVDLWWTIWFMWWGGGARYVTTTPGPHFPFFLNAAMIILIQTGGFFILQCLRALDRQTQITQDRCLYVVFWAILRWVNFWLFIFYR